MTSKEMGKMDEERVNENIRFVFEEYRLLFKQRKKYAEMQRVRKKSKSAGSK
jgi:hypothetical protein